MKTVHLKVRCENQIKPVQKYRYFTLLSLSQLFISLLISKGIYVICNMTNVETNNVFCCRGKDKYVQNKRSWIFTHWKVLKKEEEIEKWN